MTRLLLVSVFLLIAVTGLASPAGARDASGAIYLTTLPSGADAWVDGAYVGRSPVLVDALAPGRHRITTAKTGWESRELEIVVSEKLGVQFVDFQLQRSTRAPKASGKLAIHAQIPIETLAIDGVPVKLSRAATLELDPGPHELAIKTARGKSVRHIVVYAETTTNVVLRGNVDEEERAIVVAPASNYLPDDEVTLEGRRVTIRHNGHSVSGELGAPTMRIDGASMTFDSAPSLIAGRLYLPLDLYVRIGAVPLRAR